MYLLNHVPAVAWELPADIPRFHGTSQVPTTSAVTHGHDKKKYQMYFYDKAGGIAQSHAFNDVTGHWTMSVWSEKFATVHRTSKWNQNLPSSVLEDPTFSKLLDYSRIRQHLPPDFQIYKYGDLLWLISSLQETGKLITLGSSASYCRTKLTKTPRTPTSPQTPEVATAAKRPKRGRLSFSLTRGERDILEERRKKEKFDGLAREEEAKRVATAKQKVRADFGEFYDSYLHLTTDPCVIEQAPFSTRTLTRKRRTSAWALLARA